MQKYSTHCPAVFPPKLPAVPHTLFNTLPATHVRLVGASLAALMLAACGGPREHFSVFPSVAGESGRMVITPRQGAPLTLDKTTPTATVRNGEAAPIAKMPSRVQQLYQEALAAQPLEPVRFMLYFVEGSDTLTSESVREMERILAEIKQRPAPDVLVVGHTDRVGLVDDNDRLALRRADKVLSLLLGQGLAADSVSASGRGEREPLVATPDEVAEPRNRRVEIVVR